MNGKYNIIQHQRISGISIFGSDWIGRLHFLCVYQKQTENQCSVRGGRIVNQSLPYLRGIRIIKGTQLERMAITFIADCRICWAVFNRLVRQKIFENFRYRLKASWNELKRR